MAPSRGALRQWRRAIAGALAVAGFGALAPCGALAVSAPVITLGPLIGGTPQEGQVLTADASWTGDPPPSIFWTWQRCDPQLTACTDITLATFREYTVTAADVGSVLRVSLVVDSGSGSVQAQSLPTAVVTASATPPPPPPKNPNQPYAAGPTTFDDPGPAVTDPATPITGSSGPGSTTRPGPRLLSPFPVIRIKGRLTVTGARVTLFRVTGPSRVRITVVCRGHGCPRRRLVLTSAPARLRPFERDLRGGIQLTVTVTRPGFVGKSTVFLIRRGLVPERHDLCMYPGRAKATACPGA